MKKIFIATSFIMLMQVAASGQLVIQPSIPSVGLIQKNQLWNVLVVNGAAANYKCVIQFILKDRTTGLEVLTASTGQFEIGNGTKQLNANLLSPIQYNYLQAGMDNRLQGLLPAGSYVACYQLVSLSTGKAENLAEECVQFDTEPLSPPMLIFPADSAAMENAPVQFSWMPPTPEGMFDRLRYELLITEIKTGQKAEEAMQENLPFYSDGALFTNRMNYPASATAFEKDKWYAWQVVARDDRAYAGKSEVWVFKIGANEAVKKTSNDSYISINDNTADGKIFYIAGKELLVKYYSSEKSGNTRIIISTMNGTVIQQSTENIVYGDNYFKIPLSSAVDKNQLYKAEIKSLNNKTYSILFSIIQ